MPAGQLAQEQTTGEKMSAAERLGGCYFVIVVFLLFSGGVVE